MKIVCAGHYRLLAFLLLAANTSTALAEESLPEAGGTYQVNSLEGEGAIEDELFLDIDLGGDDADEGDTSFASKSARFTLQQENSYQFSEPEGIQTNRTSLRFEWDKVFAQGMYAKVDVKYNRYWNQDNRLEEGEATGGELRFRNTYLQTSWGDTSLAIGKQIIVWGESETSVVVDVFSPRNQSDFIFTSLEESRLSQLMFKLDQYSDWGHFSLLVNPEVEVDENPYSEILPAGMRLEKTDTDYNPEMGFRWRKSLGRGDYSLFLAELTDNAVVYRVNRVENNELIVNDEYGRYQMFGAASNYTRGNLAIHTEMAFNRERSFQTTGPYSMQNDGVLESDEIKASLGFSYTQNGSRNWTFGLGYQSILENDESKSVPHRKSTDALFNVSENFWHEDLSLSYMLQYLFSDDSAIHKLSTHYQMSDNFSLQADLFSLNGISVAEAEDSQSFLIRLSYSF